MTYYYKGFPQSDRDEKISMINVDELEERAKKVMPEGAYYYIASGLKMNGLGVPILQPLTIIKLCHVL